MLISVDFGHHSIKAVNECGDEVCFPSLVSTDVKEIEMLDFNNDYNIVDNLRVRYDQEYFVGELAREQADYARQNNYDNDFESMETELLINTAIALLAGESNEVELLITLPVSSYHENKDHFRRKFQQQGETIIGVYNYQQEEYDYINYNINNVVVKQQSLMSIMDYVLTADGELARDKKKFAAGHITAVDIGYYSVDDYSLKALKPQASGRVKIDGMVRAYQKLKDAVSKEYNVERKLYELESAMQNRQLKLDGYSHDISSYIDKIFDNLARYIHSNLRSQIENYRKVDNFLITGGGALHLYKKLETLMKGNVKLQEEPIMSNTRGGMKWLRRQKG